jgi:archaellum biogenesis ATPase FlaH
MDFQPIRKTEPTLQIVPSIDKVAGLKMVRSSNQLMSDALLAPPINKMVGNIWLSGELHLLFADTGIGKSIFAIQMADALSKGRRVLFLENECMPLKVLYYDFELSDRQFLTRYSDPTGPYAFSEHLFIDTIDFAGLLDIKGQSFEELLFQKMRYDIAQTTANVLVIDNITYLNTQTTQKTDTALEVMRQLIEIKRELDVSILVLAHTPKIDFSAPLTINSLAGSKHLSNFADSVSAIGRSALDSEIRYIKQVKPSRSAEIVYDSRNVITCRVAKEGNFLGFWHTGFDDEQNHLKRNDWNETDRKQQIEAARSMLANGKSYAEVAEELLGNRNLKGTIHKWLKQQGVSTVSLETSGSCGNG